MRRIYPVLSDLEDVYRRATNTSAASTQLLSLPFAFQRVPPFFLLDPALARANSLSIVKPPFVTYTRLSLLGYLAYRLCLLSSARRSSLSVSTSVSAEPDFLRSIISINGVLPTSSHFLYFASHFRNIIGFQ